MTSLSFGFSIPGKIESVANKREHWAVKADRTAGQRRKAMTLCPAWKSVPLLAITLTRFGVRELDDDNLVSAFKAIRDGIASRLGVDDKTKLIAWKYEQAKCLKGEERTHVKVEIAT